MCPHGRVVYTVYEQLFNKYIRDGTVVSGSLCLYGIPEFLKERREKEDDLKIKVTNLKFTTETTEDYEHFIRFIDLDVLENVTVIADENSLALIDKQEIKTCKNLTVIVNFGYGPRPTNFSVDQFLRLQNQHFQLEYFRFNCHDLQLFVEGWITTGREIGTRFSLGQIRYEDVRGILEHLKTHFGADEAGSNLENYFSSKKFMVVL
ncbi:hypothetical protein CRE_14635 [Caenorhabditis remanei]|uniref:F-box associated domain-containing protein n=1 Tax=Caenorhabditis remanei TaxID=31234 RepID=E3M985_CAERE|nr:hypothetical protein CRE_14635 [Caenorhabditis remanei]